MKKSALELFVKAFLKTHNNKSARKIYIEKSIALINAKLDNPCCTDLGAIIDLKTGLDNTLSKGVANILSTVPIRNNRESYERTVGILERYIGVGCCEQ